MEKYDHKRIEKKWQEKWMEEKAYVVEEDDSKEKSYLLVEFPYPSGEGLHVGHVRSYTALDIIARKRRSEGLNVLYPIGWDAFGLPTENYAVKTGIHPKTVTAQNTDTFRNQLQSLGLSFDWSREINTTDPNYYRWTQWIFLKLFEKGLAYKARMPINWCLSCKVGLAAEEVIEGMCERCGGETEKREKEQWMLKITEYADRLDKDLDDVDYWDRIKIQQRNWIGRSEGYAFSFPIAGSDKEISVFTTRIDTLFGATYMVLAPEHSLVSELRDDIKNADEVQAYIDVARKKTEIERTAKGKDKTGVELKGVKAINPGNKQEIPIYIADYVLAGYGTGAIMAVPAHDVRDGEFAQMFNIPVVEVIEGPQESAMPYCGEGALINSESFSNLQSSDAKEKIANAIGAEKKVVYKLRDWIFSRQRYWGEPIPMIHCKKCGWVPVPETELPVELPDAKNYTPTDSGESPLAAIKEWVITTCPSCGGEGARETDTMPNWAGSSWYYLRYADPRNDAVFADKEKLIYWTPVDWYNGGMEHTTLHLLYSRFWHKFLYDQGLVPSPEPYTKRTSHGLILAEDGTKMSKSKGNVVNPDEVVKNVGADTLRVYEMFTGPFDQSFAWSTDNMVGSRRFLERVWRLHTSLTDSDIPPALKRSIHTTIKKVGEDIESLKFNTAISQLMILLNEFESLERVPRDAYRNLVKLLSPFAPHMTEELWELLGESSSIHRASWPTYDADALQAPEVTIVVQVNGKVRGELILASQSEKEVVEKQALDLPQIKKWTEGKEVKKSVYIEDRLINLVT